MSRQTQKWDAQTHEDILIALINVVNPKPDDMRAVVASLHEQGYTFTSGALQYV